jgi:aminoglycoside phosphotransferase (APT) family kinase protein
MPSSFVASVLTKFAVVTQESEARLESRSGAGIHAARTADGQDAYLKLSPATQGPDAVAAARRELRFYQHLAATAPVHTPKLLNSVDTDDGVGMLLEAAGEPVPVGSWTPSMWAALGRELAALHSIPPPKGPSWNRPDALRQALAYPDRPAIEAFWAPVLPRLNEIFSQRTELERWMDALPPVFIHGDCHTDNIVQSSESLVFLDWQMSGIGRPGSDLAFLNVRAMPAGVTTPPELLESYLDGRSYDRRTLELALMAEELAAFVFQWPPFAAYNSPTGIDRVRLRAGALSEQWLDAQDEASGR